MSIFLINIMKYFYSMKQKTKFKQTEIGKIPEDWEVEALNQVADFTRGFSYSGSEKSKISGEYVFVTLNSVKEGGGFKKEFSYLTSNRLKERYFVIEKDIVIANTEQTKTGTLLGCPALVEFPPEYKKTKGVFSHHITKVMATTNIVKNYLYYYLIYNQKNAVIYHTGSVIWALDVDNWSKNELIAIPPIHEQKNIAKMLSDLDAKIELNKKINQILESIGQILFKKWFVDERKKEWEEKPIENLFKLEYGWHLPEWDRKHGEYPVFGSGGLTGTHDEFFVEGPGIIIGRAGKIGPNSVYYSHVNFCPIETTFYVKTENKKNIPFIYFLLKNLDVVNTGSSVPNLSRRDVHNLIISIPDKEEIEKFYEVTYKLLETIHKNNQQNKKLSQIRDALLPKLMSREIRVK